MNLYVTKEEFAEIRDALYRCEIYEMSEFAKIRVVNNIIGETCVKAYERYELVVVPEVKQSLLDNYNRFRQPTLQERIWENKKEAEQPASKGINEENFC